MFGSAFDWYFYRPLIAHESQIGIAQNWKSFWMETAALYNIFAGNIVKSYAIGNTHKFLPSLFFTVELIVFCNNLHIMLGSKHIIFIQVFLNQVTKLYIVQMFWIETIWLVSDKHFIWLNDTRFSIF